MLALPPSWLSTPSGALAPPQQQSHEVVCAAHMQHNRCTTPPYETSHAPEPGAHLYGIGHADLTGRQAQACERFEL